MSDSKIPKIIHQLWIGPKPAPTVFMNTWKEKYEPLGYQYMFWNEEKLQKELNLSKCARAINSMEEINGKADIFRWEILYKFGGIFADADSICIEPIDNILLEGVTAFAGWENETVRPGLVATGTMGFTPKHQLVYNALYWIYTHPVSFNATKKRAWYNVGPGLMTRVCEAFNFNDVVIYPSHYFLPIHYTGEKYDGHDKVYAYQEWGSTKQNYDSMNNIKLPPDFSGYNEEVSVVMSSLNSKQKHLRDCLNSIKSQIGKFNIELVVINDGSDKEHSDILEKELSHFELTSRFTRVKYINNGENRGLGYSLNKGVVESSNEIVFRMDTDDIMKVERMLTQINYLKENPNCALCGSQVEMFPDNDHSKIMSITRHVNITWSEYKKSKRMQNNHWIMNHPTFCFRRSKIIEAGNYDANIHSMVEDFDLILRVLKKFGKIHNIQSSLLKYRLHGKQVTSQSNSEKWKNVRNELVKKYL